MVNKTYSDTNFATQVKGLLSRIYGRSHLKNSVLERGIDYYEKQPVVQQKLDDLKHKIQKVTGQVVTDKTKKLLVRLEREERNYHEALRFERNERHQHLLVLCKDIISLCEGDNFAENNRKSAQLLGTIQLISPTQGN